MTFESFGLRPAVAAGVAAAGYRTPTPIQTGAIPGVMRGGDIIGLAQTGTGKTAAFVLPILHRLTSGPRGRVRALIVAPTRELAEQIHQAVVELGSKTGLRSLPVYGGVNINPQTDRLRRRPEIIVACPGRLLDHVGRGNVNFKDLDVLVLDEADQMLDMGFFPDIRRLLRHLPSRRQTLLFSATMPPEIRQLAAEVLRGPETVRIGITAPAETVRHALYPVGPHLKTALLLELLHRTGDGPVLVFTRTKHRAKRLGEKLARAGHRAASLQGNLSQNRRQAALDGFRDGRYQVLVATDIAARGIDVQKVSHVINFDIPNTPEAYIHRIGRTGRATLSGEAFTMITPEDTAMVRAIERMIGARVERRTLENFPYDRPAPAGSAAGSRRPNGQDRRPGRAPGSRRRRARSPRRAATGDGVFGLRPGTAAAARA